MGHFYFEMVTVKLFSQSGKCYCAFSVTQGVPPFPKGEAIETISIAVDCCKQVESFTILQSVSPNSLREICFVVTLYEMWGILSTDLWKISDKIYHLLKAFKFVKMHTCTPAQMLEIELENLAIIYQIR